jgi:molybdopterin synthase sulfur carrier subunit
MMTVQKLKLKIFGAARDIVGGREIEIEVAGQTVGALRQTLVGAFPRLNSLNSLLIAVNQKYAHDDMEVHESDEIAVIPPVSGG